MKKVLTGLLCGILLLCSGCSSESRQEVQMYDAARDSLTGVLDEEEMAEFLDRVNGIDSNVALGVLPDDAEPYREYIIYTTPSGYFGGNSLTESIRIRTYYNSDDCVQLTVLEQEIVAQVSEELVEYLNRDLEEITFRE